MTLPGASLENFDLGVKRRGNGQFIQAKKSRSGKSSRQHLPCGNRHRVHGRGKAAKRRLSGLFPGGVFVSKEIL